MYKIIPCLDIYGGRTVKGINFENIKDAGDAVELARSYVEQGADEIAALNIAANDDNRAPFAELVSRIAAVVNIPFTVGGGINSVEYAGKILDAGANKVSINTAAVRHPELITALSEKYGKEAVTVAIDTDKTAEGWKVCIDGGRTIVNEWDCVAWAKEVERLGAGAILLTSKEADGTKKGFSIEITAAVANAVNIPVIASGGAGSMEDFREVFDKTSCSAALAAGIFHFGEVNIAELKRYLEQ